MGLVAATLALLLAGGAAGLERTGQLGNLQYTVYAPDWSWQKRDLNILFVLANTGAEPLEARVGLAFPPERCDHFKVPPEGVSTSADVPAGGVVRCALTNVECLDVAPPQLYDLDLEVRAGRAQARVPYRLRTIRGAAVNSALWALVLPVFVALAWSLLFAVVLRRLAPPGSWRSSNPPLAVSEDREAWIDQSPT